MAGKKTGRCLQKPIRFLCVTVTCSAVGPMDSTSVTQGFPKTKPPWNGAEFPGDKPRVIPQPESRNRAPVIFSARQRIARKLLFFQWLKSFLLIFPSLVQKEIITTGHLFLYFSIGLNSVAFSSPAKSLTFSGFMENPLVGKQLKSYC